MKRSGKSGENPSNAGRSLKRVFGFIDRGFLNVNTGFTHHYAATTAEDDPDYAPILSNKWQSHRPPGAPRRDGVRDRDRFRLAYHDAVILEGSNPHPTIMTYEKSTSGVWHRPDCAHLDHETDSVLVREQLPIFEPHCDHCIRDFDFDGNRQSSATESD